MNKIHNDKMQQEALERLELLNASYLSRVKILNDWQLTKCVVDWDNHTSNDDAELTDEELKMIRDFEEKYEYAVYYVIQDEGVWPDGCTFPRYSLLYVSTYEGDWEFDKDECIKRCGTVPAYVINMEEPDCSEITEIQYGTEEGKISNYS